MRIELLKKMNAVVGIFNPIYDWSTVLGGNDVSAEPISNQRKGRDASDFPVDLPVPQVLIVADDLIEELGDNNGGAIRKS